MLSVASRIAGSARMRRAQGPADLLRAPLLGQPISDERAQLGVAGDLGLFGSRPSLRGKDLGVERAVLAGRVQVAAQLTADRRRGPAQRLADHGRAVTPAGHVGDPDPFLLREEPGRDRTDGEWFQRRHDLDRAILPAHRRAVLPDLCSRPADAHLDGGQP